MVERGLVGGIVGSNDAFPHPELDEYVRRHVQGMGCSGRNLRVHLRGGQSQDGVFRVVVGVNDEVRCAWMLRIAREHLQRDRTGMHLPAKPSITAADSAEQGEGIQRRNLVVFGKNLMQMLHGLGIGDVPGKLVAGAVEDIHRFHEIPLASGRRLSRTGLRCRRIPGQGRMGRFAILFSPQRMVVAERLTPMGQSKNGVDGLRFTKGLAGIFEFKTVQCFHAGQERGLRLSRAGVGKIDAAQVHRQAAGGVVVSLGRNGRAERTQCGRFHAGHISWLRPNSIPTAPRPLKTAGQSYRGTPVVDREPRQCRKCCDSAARSLESRGTLR